MDTSQHTASFNDLFKSYRQTKAEFSLGFSQGRILIGCFFGFFRILIGFIKYAFAGYNPPLQFEAPQASFGPRWAC